MFKNISDIEELDLLISRNDAVLVYFSTNECNVCKVLKPKVDKLFQSEFPEFKLAYIETNQLPNVAAQNRIFAVPTLIIFLEGKEYIRKSRSFGLDELKNEVARPYEIMFG